MPPSSPPRRPTPWTPCSPLREQFGELSAQLQSGARHLLDHPSEVPLLSMRKIAADAGVQPATLVRLAQHLGYDGWQSLRLVFVEALRGGPQPMRNAHKGWCVKAGPTGCWKPCCRRSTATWSRPAPPTPRRWRRRPPSWRRQHRSRGRLPPSYPIAFGFHYLYRLFRDSVHLVRGDAGTLEMDLRALKPDDAVLMTSFAPYSQEIVRVAEAARRAGSKVIALSDSVAAPIALKADCTLVFSVDSPSFFPSISAGMALVEALVQQLLAQEGKGRSRP